MKVFNDLSMLVEALPSLAPSDWIDLPLDALAQLEAASPQSLAAELLLGKQRFILRRGPDMPRMGYAPWLPVAVLSHIDWPREVAGTSDAWLNVIEREFGRSQLFRVLNTAIWDDEHVPEPHWPDSPVSPESRLAYWSLGLQAHAWVDEELPQFTPCNRAVLRLCEWRLSCQLPQPLRDYHLQLGVLDSAERLLDVRFDRCAANRNLEAIGPVQAVFPGVLDIVESAAPAEARALQQDVDRLVAFGDYLGNGNLWCFDRHDGTIWYLDHDTSPLFTRMFDDAGDYLDALALISLCRANALAAGRDDGDELSEAMLIQRWGKELVRKWMY